MNGYGTLQKRVWACEGKYHGIAIQCEDRTVTYEEFDRLTGHMAAILAKTGIGPGNAVILSMARTEKMLIAMYGIYKCGAAMVPITTPAPEKRIEAIREISGASLIITDEAYDRMMKQTCDPSVSFRMAESSDIAHILFTSGSTGNPKGVCRSQEAEVVTQCQFPDELESIGMTAPAFDCIAARTEVSFAFTYHVEYAAALLFGRRLILLTQEEQNSVGRIAEVLCGNPRAAIALTPSQLGVFLRSDDFVQGMRNLSVITVAGEPMPDKLREELIEKADAHTALYMLYGNTECATVAWQDLRMSEEGGRPMPYASVITLDAEDRRTADGIPGEVCVSSPQIFSHYAAGEKSREIMLEGRRYYRTGDKGVFRDGSVQCLGRIDRMIKYHGQRVELGEIEVYVNRMPAIRKCAVVDTKTENGITVIALFYESDSEITSSKISAFLSSYLPEYMIPLYQERMEKLPLNANGKCDYRKLKERNVKLQVQAEAPDSDRTETEEIVIRAAADILETKESEISKNQSMISLGIDSIRAIDLIGRLEKHGFSLTLADYFSHNVISDFAAYLEEKKRSQESFHTDHGDPDADRPDAGRNGKDDPVPIRETQTGQDLTDREYGATFLQKKWIRRQEEKQYQDGLYIVRAFLIERTYSEDELKGKMHLIAERHPALCAEFGRGKDGDFVQRRGIGRLQCEAADLSHLRSRTDDPLEITAIQKTAVRSYYLKTLMRYTDPTQNTENAMLHVCCLKLSDRISAVVMTVNHIAVDGTSCRILVRDLLEKDSIESGDPVREDSYFDYLGYVENESNRQAAAEYWKHYVKDAVPFGFRINRSFSGQSRIASFAIRLTEQEVRAFQKRCAEDRVSVPLMVTYCYGKALLAGSGEEKIAFRTLSSGRTLPVSGMESIVGCLIQEIPAVISTGDSVQEFVRKYLKAAEFGYLSEEEIWEAAWGRKVRFPLAPALVSTPGCEDLEGYLCDLEKPDYEMLHGECYLAADSDRLEIYYHFDEDVFDRGYVTNIISLFRDYLCGTH